MLEKYEAWAQREGLLYVDHGDDPFIGRERGAPYGGLPADQMEELQNIEKVVRLAGGKEAADLERQKAILGIYIEAWRRRGRHVTLLEALHGRVDRGEL